MNKKDIIKLVYVLSLVILSLYFAVRLVDQNQMVSEFPLDTVNDHSSHIAHLFFLDECGFQQHCPYWYNGFTLFESYPPGAYFAMYPIYSLFNDVQFTVFVFLLVLFVLSFLFIYLLMNNQRFSLLESSLFFIFLFGNAVSIGNFIRLGRVTELFGWTVFLFLMYIIYKYRRIRVDAFFYVSFILSYFILIMSHQSVAVLANLPILSLFLIKSWRERIFICISAIAGVILSAFWVVPYFLALGKTTTFVFAAARSLLDFEGELIMNLVAIFVSLMFFIVLFLYLRQNKYKSKDLLFYLPISLMVFLYLTRLLVFIPILRDIFPDSYFFFTLFFTILLFFKLDLEKLNIFYFVCIVLVLFSILSVVFSHQYTPYFVKHTEVEEGFLSLLPRIDDSFLMMGSEDIPTTSYPAAYYSYAPIYLNLTTPDGWSKQLMTLEYRKDLHSIQDSLLNNDCESFVKYSKKLKVVYFLAYGQACSKLESCLLEEVSDSSKVCLYKLE